jgi:hypothetical protein
MKSRLQLLCGDLRTRILRGAGLSLILLGICQPFFATTLRPLNLEELASKAGDIVSGRCIAVEREPRATHSLPIVKVTVRVDRRLKGKAERVLTFRMVAPGDTDSPGSPSFGVPRFAPGEDVILFLYPPGRSGLTSPVGLGQGKFRRIKGKDGREVAVNEFGNRPLFHHLSRQAEKRIGEARKNHGNGAVVSSDLLRMVEELVP